MTADDARTAAESISLPPLDESSTVAALSCDAPQPYYRDESVTLWHGDALAVLRRLESASVDCIVTSPPYYGLRDYGTGVWVGGDPDCTHSTGRGTNVPQTKNPNVSYPPSAHRGADPRACGRCGAAREDQQYGLEASPTEYVETMRGVFAEARRVLADDGTLWLNLGDSYSGSWGNQSRTESSPGLVPATDGRFPASTRTGAIRPGQPPAKNLMGMPWRVAFALQDDGWTLRNAIVWHKPNAMPESVTDRLSCDYEQVFMFSKSRRYHFDLDAIREPLAYPDALDGTRVFGGANKGTGEGKVGAAARRGGLHRSTYGDADTPGKRPPRVGQTPQSIEFGGTHDAAHPRGRNPGSVWNVTTQPFPAAHFAVMPTALAERCIQTSKPGGVVLDPFSGSGTTGLAATKLGRRYVGIDLSRDYLDLSLTTRLAQAALFDGETA